jgi:hypothetical protein
MKRSYYLYFILGSTVYALYTTLPEATPSAEEAEVAITEAGTSTVPGQEYKKFCQTDPLAVSCAPEF